MNTLRSLVSSRRAIPAIAAAVLAALSPFANAANLYWDGPAGNWSLNTSWSTASNATTPDPVAAPGAADIAIFNQTGSLAGVAVSLNGNQSALGLQFNQTSATQALRSTVAGQILTLGSSGLTYGTAQTDLGGTGTNAMVIALAASQSWTGSGSGLIQFDSGALPTQQAITNGTSGAVKLTFDGVGTGSKNIFGSIDDGILGGTTALAINTTGAFGGVGLVGNNLYTGGTTVTQGFLNIQNNVGIGTGALTFANNALTKSVNSGLVGGVTLTNNNALNLNGTITLAGSQNINFGTGATALQTATTLLFTGTANPVTYTIGGAITGANNLTIGVVGTNTNSLLNLNGANTGNSNANPITILGQTVRFGSGALPTGTGAIVLNGGSLAVGAGNAYTTVSSVIADTRVTKTAGSFALLGDSSENITLVASTVNLSLGAALGSVARYTGTLTPNGTTYNVGGGGGTIVFGNTNAFTGTRTLTTNGAAFNTFGGGGTVVVNGVNNFDGAVTLGVGTLEVASIGSVGGGSSALGAPTTAANGTITFGVTGSTPAYLRYTGTGETTNRVLNFSSFSGSSAGLDASGSGAINYGGTFTQNSGNTNRFFVLRGINTGANIIAGSMGITGTAGGFNLTKQQRGNWTLTNTNNFVGTNNVITITGGTLTADYTTNASVLGTAGTTALSMGGSALSIIGNAAGTTTQTLGNLTTTGNAGQNQISVTGNGSANTANLTIGNTITRNANTYVNFNLVSGGTVTTSPTVTNGLIGGLAAFTVTDSTSTDFATITSGKIAKLAAATALPAATGSATTNYVLAGNQTLTANVASNSTRIDTSAGGGILTLSTFNVTGGTGEFLMSGANDYTISGTGLGASGTTIGLSNYGAGKLTISALATSGSGGLNKTGPGLVELGIAQTYTGSTNIVGGVLRVNSTIGTGNISLNTGGIYEIGSASTFNRTVGTGASQVQWGNGDGGFSAFGGNRTVALTNNLSVAIGQLVWGSTSGNNNVVVPNASPAFVKDGFALLLSSSTATGTLDFQNPIDFVNLPRTVQVGDGSAVVDAVLSGVLSSSDYSGGLYKIGTGTLAVTAANTYTGQTSILAGTLQLGNGDTTGSLSPSSAITNNSTLAFNRTNTLTQGTDFATISGSGVVSQAGSGTTVLTAANTYAGVTTASAGTLLVNNTTGSGTGTGNVVVNSSGTILGGKGIISGSVNIGMGSILTTGATAATTSIGKLTVGALTLASTSSFNLQVGGLGGVAGTDFDQLVVMNLLTYAGVFNVADTGGFDLSNQAGTYQLLSFGSGMNSGNFSNVNVDGNALTLSGSVWSGTTGGGDFAISFNQGTGVLSFDPSPVPEPSTWLGALALVGIVGYRESRRLRRISAKFIPKV